tara:strand:- start:790 stop:936 length:147 start_codon:yes stop_codon:yes gene_type:complete
MVKAALEPEFQSVDVHKFWVACTIFEGIREEQLLLSEVGEVYDKSGIL